MKINEPNQWTLDRLNNDIGHFNDNVVICCLTCNLKKEEWMMKKLIYKTNENC